MGAGKFSSATLAEVAPSSFQIADEWELLLKRAGAAHGWDHLLHTHLGIIYAERRDFKRAEEELRASIRRKEKSPYRAVVAHCASDCGP